MIRFIYCLCIFLAGAQLSYSQNALQVNPVDPVNNPLIDSLVGKLVGNGVIVENIRSNLSESTRALATFKADAQLLNGIRSGLMMVTGVADTMAGTNNGIISAQMGGFNYADTIDGCSSGRQMLNAVLADNSTVQRKATDCATIQFDIIPATDSIKFNYVFASEEYNTFVCSNFNDIFGFFIRGPGIVGDQNLAADFPETRNIAIIPGTDLPVSINTVNNGTPGSGTPANCTFTPQGIASYIDNSSAAQADDPFVFNNLKFNGLTTKLQAAVKVIPCQTYTLTLTISDVTDRSYDSGVFIEAGSLRSSGVTLAQTSVFNTRFPYAIVDCNPGKFIFERCAANTIDPLIARYKVGGTAINGVDYKQLRNDGQLVTLPDSFVLASGQFMDSLTLVGLDNPNWQTQSSKSVVIRFLNSNRPYINGQPNYRGDSTVLTIKRKFIYRASDDIAICRGEDSLLLPITESDPRDRYRWVQLAGPDTIPTGSLSCTDCDNPRSFADSTTTYVLFVKDSLSGCVSNDTVKVTVVKLPELEPTTDKPGNIACRILDKVRLIANPPDADPSWTYQWQEPLEGNTVVIGGADSLKKQSLQLKRIEFEQFYKVLARNILGCETLDSVEVKFPGKPVFNLTELKNLCIGDSILLMPDSESDTTQPRFSWRKLSPDCGDGRSIGEASFMYKPLEGGDCLLELTAENCRGLVPDLDLSKVVKIETRNCGAFVPNLVIINGEIERNRGFYIFQITSDKNNPDNWPFLNGGRLRIYNRWGKEVYASDDYNNELSYEKLKADYKDGVYFYEYDNKEIEFKRSGYFNIQR